MNKEAIRDYLELTAMSPVQAEALSHILSEMATKSDLNMRMAELEARLTWRIIAITGFFATVSGLVNVFLG